MKGRHMANGRENLANEIRDFLIYESDLGCSDFCPFGTDSPIESLLICSIKWACKVGVSWFDLSVVDPVKLSPPNDNSVLQFCSQVKIGDFRVDFLFTVVSEDGVRSKLVVECDGHNFHERTKEQAARDRSRDRQLQQSGYTVFRFTGSEIYNRPLNCARQVLQWAEHSAWKKKGE